MIWTGVCEFIPRIGWTVCVSTRITLSMRRFGRSSSRTNGKHVGILGQKCFEIAIHLARQDGRGVGVEPGRGQHAGQRIEIRVLVGQDDGNGLNLGWP